ncbi:hypothetical protein BJX63DRAFT_417085, partial [Aspergillus granulosus]
MPANLPTSSNTDGYNAARIISTIKSYSDKEQKETLKPSQFKLWLQKTMGIHRTSNTPRMLAILRNYELSQMALQFCETAYGQSYFNWWIMERISNAKLNFIWYPEISRFLDFSSQIFGDQARAVSVNDWNSIMELPLPPETTRLNQLFWPDQAPWVDPQNRRPKFLVELSDEQYKHVWQQLGATRISCPTWNSWVLLEKNISSKIILLLSHIACWFQPSWSYPSPASKELKKFSWDQCLAHIIWPTPAKDDVISEPEDNPQQKAQDLILGIWNQIKANSQWINPYHESLLRMPNFLEMENSKQKLEEYYCRFQYPHWLELLQLVLYSCPSTLTGPIVQFRQKLKDESLFSSSTWGPITCQANFQQNPELFKLPGLNTAANCDYIAEEANLFGAIISYRMLKQALLDVHQQRGGKSAQRIIQSEEQYNWAKQILFQKARLLQEDGWHIFPDDWNEALDKLTVSRAMQPPRRAITPCPGFLSATYPSGGDVDSSSETENDVDGGDGGDNLENPNLPRTPQPVRRRL